MIGLILTVITFLLFKKLRDRPGSKVHVQLCVALFCMLLVFVSGIDQTDDKGGCVAVSALIHYFTLAAVMWMGAESVVLFQLLVVVFVRITTKKIAIISLICWLLPLPFVVALLAVDTDYMLTFTSEDPNDIEFCFIGDKTVFIGAFLGPIFAVIGFNFVAFVIMVGALIKLQRRRAKRATKRRELYQGVVRLLIATGGLVALFGLTWLFAVLTVTDSSIAFEVLFALCNTTQGFYIFLLFCVFSADSRAQWKEAFNRLLGDKLPGRKSQSKMLQFPLRRRGNPPSHQGTIGTLEGTMGLAPTDKAGSTVPRAEPNDLTETPIDEPSVIFEKQAGSTLPQAELNDLSKTPIDKPSVIFENQGFSND